MDQGGFTKFINSQGLAIFMLIIALIIFGFLIANAVYFYRIKTDTTQSAVSQSDANTMMWINIVLAIIMFLFIIYYAVKSMSTTKAFKQIQTKFEAQANAGFAAAEKGWAAAEKGYENIADPLKQVYQAGVKAGAEAAQNVTKATDQAAKAAAAAYTAAARPYFVAPVIDTPTGQQTVLLYHDTGSIYRDSFTRTTGTKYYDCNGDNCRQVKSV